MSRAFRFVRASALWALVVFACSFTPAFAQTTPTQTTPTPQPPSSGSSSSTGGVTDRLVLVGDGGIALGDEHKAGAFNGELGIRLFSHLSVLGDFGRLTNILPDSLDSSLTLNALTLANQSGGPVTITRAAVPVNYGLAIVHADLMTDGVATPYIEGGIGEAHVTSELAAESSGVSFATELASTVTLPATANARMVTANVGVTLRFRKRVGVDVGYRYSQIGSGGSKLMTSGVFAGVRFGF
jgi:opacity protein-like surface antigen